MERSNKKLSIEERKIVIDFYNKFDVIARLISNCNVYDLENEYNVRKIIGLIESFINVIQSNLFDQIDSATVQNLFTIIEVWIKRLRHKDKDYARKFTELISELTKLMYDIEHNIVRKPSEKAKNR